MAIPFIEIELDKPRKLRFGLSAMVSFEQLTGKKLMEIEEEMSLETISQMLWCMLKQDDPELTLESTCILIDEYADSITTVTDAVTRALQAAMGKPKNAGKPRA